MTLDPPRPLTSDHPRRSEAAVTDYPRVSERAAELGWPAPAGIAVLPSNFADAAGRADLRLPSEASTVHTLLRNEGLPVAPLRPDGERIPFVSNNSFGWVGPTLFISAGLMSSHPHAVSVALGVLTNYLSDLLKGSSRPKTAKLDVVVERSGDYVCRKLTYEGPVEGLPTLAEQIRALSDG